MVIRHNDHKYLFWFIRCLGRKLMLQIDNSSICVHAEELNFLMVAIVICNVSGSNTTTQNRFRLQPSLIVVAPRAPPTGPTVNGTFNNINLTAFMNPETIYRTHVPTNYMSVYL